MRILAYIGMIFVALWTPLPFLVLLACLYALVYTPYELLFLAVCIDAAFFEPARHTWFVYTTVMSGVLIASTFIKPHLRFYT